MSVDVERLKTQHEAATQRLQPYGNSYVISEARWQFLQAMELSLSDLLAEHTRLRATLAQIAHDPYIDQNAAAVRELARKALNPKEDS